MVACVVALIGCGSAEKDAPSPGPDLRLKLPELTVPAFSERQWCYFFTWDGPDVAIRASHSHQDPAYGHHLTLFRSVADQPDGAVIDCTAGEADRILALPLFTPGFAEDGVAHMELPEGYAVKLEHGARLMLQTHYVNYSEGELVFQDWLDLDLVPLDEVETWAAMVAHNIFEFEVPAAGEGYTAEVTCDWKDELDLIVLFGHMHEFGRDMAIDLTQPDGIRRIYEVERWRPPMRDAPPVHHYAPGELRVGPGRPFTTRCRWDNPTDTPLSFPTEMCVSVALAAPLERPIVCNDGQFLDLETVRELSDSW